MQRPNLPSDEERFINLIRRYPCLYDRKNTSFGDTQLKSELWQDIGSAVQISGTDAKLAWIRFRSRYISRRKNHMTLTKFDNQMSFLDDFINWEKNVAVSALKARKTKAAPSARKRVKSSHAASLDSPFRSALAKCMKPKPLTSGAVAEQPTPQSSDEFDILFQSFANITKLLPTTYQTELLKEIQDVILEKTMQFRKMEAEQKQQSETQARQAASNRSSWMQPEPEAVKRTSADSASKAPTALGQDFSVGSIQKFFQNSTA